MIELRSLDLFGGFPDLVQQFFALLIVGADGGCDPCYLPCRRGHALARILSQGLVNFEIVPENSLKLRIPRAGFE